MQAQRPIRKPKRPCKEIGCNNLTRYSYCKTHKKTGEKIAQENVREYNRKSRDQKTNAFYKSRAWQKLRALAFERDNGLCQVCLKRGRLVQADVVHHLIEVKEDWSKRLELDNLESVCHRCHNQEHKSHPRG